MVIETFGSIIKEETVKTVERGAIANTLVLENLGLFPGYYGAEMPHNQMPDSLFLGITNKESTEKIFRITQNIKKQSGLRFEGTPASICVFNNTFNSIRVRGLSEYSQIGELQGFYRDAGIELMKGKKIESEGVIQIKKIFKVSKLTETIFKDEERNMYYFKIDEQLTWSHFKNITTQVRNNVSLSAFDAALAVFYASEVHDLVRVYSKSMKIEELETLHAKYNELIKKSMK